MDLNDIKWENGQGLSDIAVFGTNPIGTMLGIAIELLEDLDLGPGEVSDQRNKAAVLLYEAEQKTMEVESRLYEFHGVLKAARLEALGPEGIRREIAESIRAESNKKAESNQVH